MVTITILFTLKMWGRKMKFEVLTYTVCDGWVNCWSVTDRRGKTAPQLFDTWWEAQAEIDGYMADRLAAGMDCDDQLMIARAAQ